MSASPPSKKRTSRACVYCKSRKQKCGGYTAEIKCSACQQRKIRCSFEDEAEDPRYNPYLRYEQAAARQNAMYNGNGDEPSGTGSSAIGPFRTGSRPSIGDSNGGHNGHRDSWQHIAPQAEAGPSRQHSTAGLPLNPPQSIAMAGRVSSARNDHLSSPHSQSPPIRSPLPSDFRGPLRTLQHLVSDDLKSVEDVDPIRRHVITPGEASMLFQIFFKNCHAHAPFLDVQANSDWKKCQDSSSLLFLGILQVAARYWGHSSRADSWLHPRYNELVALLDMEVTRLTLRPRDGDASLATLQGLMLYAHWMPLEVAPHGQVRFRFSETGAWQALGLAIRWATQLDLDSVADFSAETGNVQEFRTVAYLTESDHYVSLSTRRRPTLDTQGLAIGCSAFLASGRTQSTDLRLVSLLRVAHASSIILRGVVSGSVSVESVKAFNEDVIQVERDYIETASRQGGGVDSHARQFPYTSLRWYRLAFASVLLNSASPWSAIGEMFHWAVNWASQILFFLSGSANRGERNLTDDTGEPLLPDPSLVHFLTFAIDHYYVVVAYSAAFLVVAWRQGAIDGGSAFYRGRVNVQTTWKLAPKHPIS
ncbi:hypothetical protein BD324DRAFT_482718 [Kockovaella imperatae]|uniref:Zn(2)-C6 fungal-type domain-containing protein n=1 Tax=Kockovaella imperatae TaxID=4999 RepID=A0A1Y1UGQ3_9TREE|nr:hypothetical protein BD324DRAFT_482718 [Kockovaella imperatae]ORX36245.1 hypothetical protein BD324DRAFT_482718 [Kockovaella imperatae]